MRTTLDVMRLALVATLFFLFVPRQAEPARARRRR
jgi:hypothetical protein